MPKNNDEPQMTCKCYTEMRCVANRTVDGATEVLFWCPSCGYLCWKNFSTLAVSWRSPELVQHHKDVVWALITEYTQGAAEIDILSVPADAKLEIQEGWNESTIYLARRE